MTMNKSNDRSGRNSTTISVSDISVAQDRQQDSVSQADLDRVLLEVPRGAFMLCALALALLVICWLAIYFGIFVPRGPIS